MALLPLRRSEGKVRQTAARKPTVRRKAHSPTAALFLLRRREGKAQAQEERQGQRSAPPQAKLNIGAVDDSFEREADAVAEQVVRASDPQSAAEYKARAPQGTALRHSITPLFLRRSLQRQADGTAEPAAFAVDESAMATLADEMQAASETEMEDAEEGTEPPVQAKPVAMGAPQAHEADADFEARLHARKGAGQALPGELRGFMESRLGADFSAVRVHRGAEADALNRRISARAFTHGADIFFAAGQFRPNDPEGRRLLAHELTHVIQQGAAPPLVVVPGPVLQSAPAGRVQRGLREWLAEKANSLLRHIPGFTLLTVIVGYNPVLGQEVARSPRNLLEGVISLLPGGALLFDRLNETGAVEQAANWLRGEIDALGLSLALVRRLFSRAWDEMGILEGIAGNVAILKRIFGDVLGRILRFVGRVAGKIREFVFRGVLRLVGAPVERVMALLNRGAGVLRSIFDDPIGFIRNLFLAVKRGLGGFVQRIGKYLREGLVAWLTGAISEAGLRLPERWDLRGVVSLAMQILGLTYANVRAKLARRLGERAVSRIEQVVTLVREMMTRGPIVLWERIKRRLTSLKDTVMNAIRSWVITKVIVEGVGWLLGLLNPAAGLVKLVRMLVNVVMFFVNNWERLLAFVNSVFGSLAAITAGRVADAARFIEQSLARMVPLLIGFFARLLGLGGISDKIREIMRRVRRPIERAIDAVVVRLVRFARKLLRRLRSGIRRTGQGVLGWWRQRLNFSTRKGENHSIYFRGQGATASLMVNSSPKTFAAFLQQQERVLAPRGERSQRRNAELLQAYRDMRDKYREIQRAIEARKRSGDDSELAELRALRRKTKAYMDKLEEFGEWDLEETKIAYSGGRHGFAGVALAEPLTRRGKPGSEPTVSDNAFWQRLRRRRQGNRSYYVRGHLINHNVHGPGNTWKNLTPITQDANRKHEQEVESKVKQAVNEGQTLSYKVEAKYGRGVNTSLITAIERDQRADARTKALRKDIVQAEQALPLRLVCTVKKKKDQGQGYESWISNYPIPNIPAQGSPDDYQVEAGPVPRYRLLRLNLSQPVPEGFQGDERQVALEAYTRLPNIGQRRAAVLFEMRTRLVGPEQTKEALRQRGISPSYVDAWQAAGFEVRYSGTTRWEPSRTTG